MSDPVVLDASAVLSLIQNEPGAARVAASLPAASISAVNFAEIVAKLVSKGGTEHQVLAALNALELQVVPFDADQALLSGLMITETRPLGLSLGDRACLALARLRRVSVLTSDKAWAALPPEIGVSVEVIR